MFGNLTTVISLHEDVMWKAVTAFVIHYLKRKPSDSHEVTLSDSELSQNKIRIFNNNDNLEDHFNRFQNNPPSKVTNGKIMTQKIYSTVYM